MAKLLLVWLVNALALLALPYVVPSVQVSGFTTALVAALVLGLVNTLIRPLLVLLTLPVTIVTLGLFILVINGLLFWLGHKMIRGVAIQSFGSAMLAGLVSGLINWGAMWLLHRLF